MTTQTATGIDEEIGRLVGDIRNLPTPPIVFTQIQKVLNDPNTSAYDIGSILQEDPAISAKVLKMTNSAYYGLSRTIESVKQAVVIIGIEAVKNLVLSAAVIESFSKDQVDSEFQEFFWRHSLAAAFAARMLSRELRGSQIFDGESAFSAGMLHDIGKMVISVYMPDQAKKIRNLKSEKPLLADRMVETEVLGFDHTHIGAYLGRHWQLPEKLLEAVRYHHDPGMIAIEQNNLPYLIHLSNFLAFYTFEYDPEEDTIIEPLLEDALMAVDIAEEKLRNYVGGLREEYLKAETFMEMARGMA